MTDLPYGLSSYERDRGNFPKLPLINMFVEQVPTEENPVLQSRPGLAYTGTSLGAGSISALYQIEGVLSNQLFAVSNNHFYDDTTDIGAVVGNSYGFKIAGFRNRVFINGGIGVYQYDGTTLSTVTMPGGFDVTSICIGSDRLIVIDAGTGHFYWSDVLSPTVGALSFATAENSPDNLKECLFLGDTLLLFGTETVEQWPVSSSNPDLPYTPLVGRTYQVGIRDPGCATLFTNSFAWVTNHNQICVGDPNTVISTASIEEKLTQSNAAKLWSFRLEGTQFLVLTLDAHTYVFSSTSSQWSEFQSYGQGNWIPQCYAANTFGSGIDGHLIEWSTDHSDFGDVLERRFRAGSSLTSGTIALNNVMLRTNLGQTPFLTGTYANPTVELRTSMDGGFEWGTWKQKSLGVNGQYRNMVMWRSLGYFGYPGLLLEIRVTDPVPFRVSGLVINEGYGGV